MLSTAEPMPTALRWLLYGAPARCVCDGDCGRTHDGGRCTVATPAALKVAPGDPRVSVPVLGALPADELAVWCVDCHELATSAARPGHQLAPVTSLAAATAPESLGVAA